MLLDSLFAHLSRAATETVAASAASALLGADDQCRLYPGSAPAGVALPYAVMTLVASDENPAHGNPNGPVLSDVQFTIVAGTHREAALVRAALRADLSPDGATAEGAKFTLPTGEEPVEFSERQGFSEATDQHVALLTVSLWHEPALS